MLRTAEFVSPGHPDKLCDQIADAILDACLNEDPNTRAAIEVMGGHKIVTVTGELTTKAFVNVQDIVKSIVGQNVGVQTNIVTQSQFIAQGVDVGGAGDQGVMIGYACNTNDEMIPQEAYLARSLNRYLFNIYNTDGKTQITLDDNDNKVTAIVASFQLSKSENLRKELHDWAKLNNVELPDESNIHINPAGEWEMGGFDADTGVTGRKLAVDNYGPRIPLGGGAFSGKDSTKVDRSGAYMARRVAVDYLKKYNAKEVRVRLAYAIGVAEPVQATAVVDGKEMNIEGYDLTPKGIINSLGLNKPIFLKTAQWGHFGNKFNWDN